MVPLNGGLQTTEGFVVLRVSIRDKGELPLGATGTRLDGEAKDSVLIKIIDKQTWAPLSSDGVSGRIAGQITRKNSSSEEPIRITRGHRLTLVAQAKDVDYWKRTVASPKSGEAQDEITYDWSATGGRIFRYVDGEAWWTAPNTVPAGTRFTISVKIDDKAIIPEGDDAIAPSSRDDEALTLSLTVEVIDDPSIQEIRLSPENPITSGQDNTPAATITFSALVADPKQVVEKVEWNCPDLGLSGSSTDRASQYSWTSGPIPPTAIHREYEVSAKLFWPAEKSSVTTRKFKLFFGKNSNDEDTSATGFKSPDDHTPVSPPNWYDHWKLVVPQLGEAVYVNNIFVPGGLGANGMFDAKSLGVFGRPTGFPRGTVFISNSAAETKDGGAPPHYVYSPYFKGIDACAAIVLHEFRHKWLHEQSWGGYTDALIGFNGSRLYNIEYGYDKDADGIKDSWETTTWGQPDFKDLKPSEWSNYKYWRNMQYDGNSFQTDHEFEADMNGARLYVAGTYNSLDWANPGKQSNPSY